MFKKVTTALSLLFFGLTALVAQTKKQELKISKAEVENLFLDQNLDLLAKKLEISQAEAQLIQAKLWPNPTFELSEVNFWKTNDVEEQSLLIGNWGTSQQIAMHLEQEIETAGKRRKRINLQKLTIEERKTDFEIVLRETKLELRNTLSSIQMLQRQQEIFKQQIDNTTQLIKGYENQLKQGNISQSEYIRLKAAQLQFKKELVDTNKDLEEAMKDFIGFGIGFDIPIFDRNKGNIKEAQIGLQIAELEAKGKANEVVNDIIEALKNYTQTKELYDQIDAEYEAQLDKLLEAYVKNFQQRNVSLIEYLDFVEAYIDNKNILLETVKNLNEQFEHLQFTIGKDL